MGLQAEADGFTGGINLIIGVDDGANHGVLGCGVSRNNTGVTTHDFHIVQLAMQGAIGIQLKAFGTDANNDLLIGSGHIHDGILTNVELAALDTAVKYSDESIAIVSLLHDLCKVNIYKKGFRNVKDERGVWQRVDTFEYDDKLPYGHGEKSVYIISGYMKLTREEAFAIRYHMGYSSTEDARNVSAAFEMFPLAFALSTADSEATYFIESKNKMI